jgi:hypothetical protein
VAVTTHAPPPTHHRVRNRDGDVVEFEGWLLGSGSSKTERKLRWFEVDLYRTVDGRYLTHTRGMSRLAGERTLHNLTETTNAVRVAQGLIVHNRGRTFMPDASADALEEAGVRDEGVRLAYAALPSELFARESA